MPYEIPGIPGVRELEVVPLSQAAFAPFGSVVQNPAPTVKPSPEVNIPSNAALVNQGTAFKYLDVTRFQDMYEIAPSKVPAKTVFNMFVCAPRALSPASRAERSALAGLFGIHILERHPYTSQTFIPMGLSPGKQDKTRYLVVVAPTLPEEQPQERFPTPRRTAGSTQHDASGNPLPGNGLPDLTKLRAFWADGSQAVTYAAGTWHAPMVVLGEKAVAFTVVQAANGVGIEDCQEVKFASPMSGGQPEGASASRSSAEAAGGIFVKVPTIHGSVSEDLELMRQARNQTGLWGLLKSKL